MKNKSNFFNLDLLFLLSIIGIVLLMKFSVLHLPFTWDEPLTFIEPAHKLLQDGLWSILPGLGNPHGFYHHPPFFPFALAVFYKIFGESIFVSRLFALAISLIGIFFTYLLGKRLRGPLLGILAASFLFLTPIFYAQSSLLLSDQGTLALGVMSTYFFLEKKWCGFFLASSLLALGRETSLAFSTSFLIYGLIFFPKKELDLRKIMLLLWPIVVLLSYFLSQKLTTGKAFHHEAYAHFSFTFDLLRQNSSRILDWVFSNQGRWHYFLFPFLYCVWKLNATQKGDPFWQQDFFLFLMIMLFFWIGLTFDRGLLFRYLNPILPFFFLLSAYALLDFFKKKYLLWGMIAFLLYQNSSHYYYPNQGHDGFDYNMEYTRVIYNQQSAIGYLAKFHRDHTIMTVWPLWPLMRYPYLGHTDVALKAVEENASDFDVLVWTSNASPDKLAILDKKIVEEGLKLEKTFETHFKVIKIYAR